MNFKELIEEKRSSRDYKKKEVSDSIIKEMLEYGQTSDKLVRGIEVDITVKNKDDVYERLINIAGYEGKMIEAPHYIVLTSEIKEDYIENSGYLGENLMLKLQDLDVDSCWITFSDSNIIKERIHLDTDKEVTALIAFGYGVSQKKMINLVKTGGNYSKANMQEKKYISDRLATDEIVYLEKWGNKPDLEYLEQRMLAEPLSYATLAPSTLNRQPWRFIIDKGMLVLAVRDDEATSTYEERIDAGIQMLYFDLVMQQTLMKVNWIVDKPEKNYDVPAEYNLVAYCKL